jgi:hypothetical protein
VTRGAGALLLGAALLVLLAAAPRSATVPGPADLAPNSVLPRAEVVARAERRLSPPGRGPVAAKLTTWRALGPVVANRRGGHTPELVTDPDRRLWALLVDGQVNEGAGTVIAADAATGEWLGDFGLPGDPKGLPARFRQELREARTRWDQLPDRARGSS